MNKTKLKGNFTEVEEEHDFNGFYPPLDLPLIVIALLSIFSNSLVLYLLKKKEYLRTPKNLFLGSLAICDLFTGVLNIPLFIACSCTPKTPLCVTTAILNHFSCLFDVLQLLAITLDRLTAVVCPLKYPQLMNTTRANYIILFIFLVSGFGSFIQLIWLGSPDFDVNAEAESDASKYEMAYDCMLFVFFFIPVCIMTYAITRVFFIVHRHNKELQKRGSDRHARLNSNERSRWPHEMRSTIILTTMLLTYVLFWSAYFIIRLQSNFGDKLFHLPVDLENAFLFLRYSTCVSNPLLYTLRNHDFKVALKAERDSINRRREFMSSWTKSTIVQEKA